MLGALTGDIAGSIYEFDNLKSKKFPLFGKGVFFTDDSVMTLAVAEALMRTGGNQKKLSEEAVRCMQSIGSHYMECGYGETFIHWITDPDPKPYNSWGNGSAMRVSACGYVGKDLEEVLQLADRVTEVTHNHPEGMKGAEAVAAAVFLARQGSSKDEIRRHMEENYYRNDFTLDEIRPSYTFDVSCQGSVPQALQAFYEGTDFEDTIRNAISIGGDSDTIAAIAGSIAGPYFGIPDEIRKQTLGYLDDRLLDIALRFEEQYEK